MNIKKIYTQHVFQILICFQAKIKELAIGDISSEQFFLSENYVV